jgi:antitoxin component HigA of HigAB toxin-antitoxin module
MERSGQCGSVPRTVPGTAYIIDIKPIGNEADYEAALEEIERLWGSEPGTPDGDRFEVLFTRVEAYEDQHYPILHLAPFDCYAQFTCQTE